MYAPEPVHHTMGNLEALDRGFDAPPRSGPGKHISFELLLEESGKHKSRLPMRVNIYPHDTTESIVTTVKNFYGLYDPRGISFEDRQGLTLIANYENFEPDMTVYVRTAGGALDQASEISPPLTGSLSPNKPRLEPPFEMRPPSLPAINTGSRPPSRAAGSKRSVSPQSAHGRPGPSMLMGAKTRSFDGSTPYALDEGEFSGTESVSSSRRELASAEISVDNIVEGGRRKQAKFESSQLPLFVPPQVPSATSISSVSPQRRPGLPAAASPFSFKAKTYAYPPPLPSPQSYGHVDYISAPSATSRPFQPPAPRVPSNGRSQSGGRRSGSGILPTPDPTISSVISDEDVALQLMRLGDPSNFSLPGRTSTSTLDDAFSGKAEIASSATDSENDYSDEEDGGRFRTSTHSNGGHNGVGLRGHPQDDYSSDVTDSSGDDYHHNPSHNTHHAAPRGGAPAAIARSEPRYDPFTSTAPPRPTSTSANGHGTSESHSHLKMPTKKIAKPRAPGSKPKTPGAPGEAVRKLSNGSSMSQHAFAADEDDLSSKPRCQRCRKSKKGCDRERPCGRCKDAGIGIEGCISEDEGNGRKGRYGRHMGVPIKRSAAEMEADGNSMSPTYPPSAGMTMGVAPSNGMGMGVGIAMGNGATTLMAAPPLPNPNKKRKKTQQPIA